MPLRTRQWFYGETPTRAVATVFSFLDLLNLRRVGDSRSSVKDFLRILRLNRQHRRGDFVRVLRFDVDFEFALTSFLHFGFKIRSGRRDLEVFDGKIFAHFYIDRLCVRFIPLFPKDEIWGDLELLWDFRLERERRFLICGFVGLYRYGFDLGTGAIA